jgi:hypothetical protein
MGEEGQESGSAASAAALHGPGGHVEHPGGFRDRITLHVHQDEGGSLVGREGAERLQELPVEVIALRGSRGRLVRLQQLFQALGVVDRRRLPGGRLAGSVKAGVHRDPVQPGRDGRLATEGVGGPVCRNEGVLDGVGGLLAVPQCPQGDGPEPVAVAAHELTERVGVTLHMAGQEVLIAYVAVRGALCHRTPSPDDPLSL